MYDYKFGGTIAVICIIFIFMYVLLKKYFPKWCTIDRKNANGEKLKQIAKKEKDRMIMLTFLLSVFITVIFLLWFGYITNSIYYTVELSIIVIGVFGAFFVTMPALSLAATYLELIVNPNISERLIIRKEQVMCGGTGLFLIIFSYVIRLGFLFQTY